MVKYINLFTFNIFNSVIFIAVLFGVPVLSL
jgi:hypothetical protein